MEFWDVEGDGAREEDEEGPAVGGACVDTNGKCPRHLVSHVRYDTPARLDRGQ